MNLMIMSLLISFPKILLKPSSVKRLINFSFGGKNSSFIAKKFKLVFASYRFDSMAMQQMYELSVKRMPFCT